MGEPHRDVAELQRPGAIRGVGPVDHRGGEEEAGLDHRDRRGGEREPEVDLPPPDGDRREMGDECARGDRMREREKRRADRIDGPPDRVPALHRAREQRGREQHRRKRHGERLDRTGDPDDAEGRRQHERAGGARVPARQPASEAIRRDGRDDGGDDGGEPHPLLGVVPRRRRGCRTARYPARAGSSESARSRTSVNDPCAAATIAASSMSSERRPSPTRPSDQRERGAEVRAARDQVTAMRRLARSSETACRIAVCAGTLTAAEGSDGSGVCATAAQSQRFQRKNASWASVVVTIRPTETPSVQ